MVFVMNKEVKCLSHESKLDHLVRCLDVQCEIAKQRLQPNTLSPNKKGMKVLVEAAEAVITAYQEQNPYYIPSQ